MNPEPAAEPTPAKYRFEWLGRQFTWKHSSFAHFRSDTAEDQKWWAEVHPEGWSWNAKLVFLGGECRGVGDTPQNALTSARQVWLNEVSRAFNGVDHGDAP